MFVVCSRSSTDVPGVEVAETVSGADVVGFANAIVLGVTARLRAYELVGYRQYM